MKIIDAHLHLFPTDEDWAEQSALRVGHHNSIDTCGKSMGSLIWFTA